MRLLAAVGALLAAIGLLGMAWSGWQVWGTDPAAAAAQRELSGVLDEQWRTAVPTVDPAPVEAGDPIARLTIPRLGDDWTAVLLEGIDPAVIDRGPGHYPGTAQPGQPGNFAVAGHRVGHGAPFYAADELRACDEIHVQMRDTVYTYRVLPAAGDSARCALPDVGLPGRHIVDPSDVQVIAPVPPGARPGQALLTITTCHPRYSAQQRLIVHAALTEEQPAP